MILERNETPEELAFALTFPQIREAHEIYKKHCFFQDFIEHCEERRQERTGRCNLPYQTLEQETDILCTAYELYERHEDSNVSYNVMLEGVIDAIEEQIANGELCPHTEPAPRMVLVIEDGVITGSYTSEPAVRVEVIELSKEYASSEERDAVYAELESNPELCECGCQIRVPGYEDEAESGEME